MDPRVLLLQKKVTAEEAVQRYEGELRSAKAKLAAINESLPALEAGGDDSVAAVVMRRCQDKVKREQADIAEIEAAIVDARGRVSGFDEVLKMFPKDGDDSELRVDSMMFKVREALRAAGKPMSLSDILTAIGEEGKRNSLRGSLASYANKGRVFTKEDAPETFGLIEFRNGGAAKAEES
jgi:hypothetical protein